MSIERIIGPHITLYAGYQRMHQSYGAIAAVSNSPDSNREFVSVTYRFEKPLGR